MATATTGTRSIFGLFRGLTGDVRTLLRQELELVKTEVSEKISCLGRNAAALAVGGCVAYAGLIVLLFGLGWLLAAVLAGAGLSPMFAGCIGLSAVGLLVIVIGSVLLLKAMKTLSSSSLAPQRTIHTLHELKTGQAPLPPEPKPEPAEKPSSRQLQTRVEATENRMGETLDEIGHRLSPRHINAEIKHRIQARPYQAGLAAMVAGLVSGLLVRRRFRHAG